MENETNSLHLNIICKDNKHNLLYLQQNLLENIKNQNKFNNIDKENKKEDIILLKNCKFRNKELYVMIDNINQNTVENKHSSNSFELLIPVVPLVEIKKRFFKFNNEHRIIFTTLYDLNSVVKKIMNFCDYSRLSFFKDNLEKMNHENDFFLYKGHKIFCKYSEIKKIKIKDVVNSRLNKDTNKKIKKIKINHIDMFNKLLELENVSNNIKKSENDIRLFAPNLSEENIEETSESINILPDIMNNIEILNSNEIYQYALEGIKIFEKENYKQIDQNIKKIKLNDGKLRTETSSIFDSRVNRTITNENIVTFPQINFGKNQIEKNTETVLKRNVNFSTKRNQLRKNLEKNLDIHKNNYTEIVTDVQKDEIISQNITIDIMNMSSNNESYNHLKLVKRK